MEILVPLCGGVAMIWLGTVLIISEIRHRRKNREFYERLRKMSNTTYSTSSSGAVVRYDVNIDDYPSNIIEIGRGSR